MKKRLLFYFALVFTIVGLSLTGLGIGIIFYMPWVGVMIGLGLGLTVSAFILLRVLRRASSLGKK